MINVKKTKRDFLELLHKPSKNKIKKVLDLGCGRCFLSLPFANNAEIIAVDKKKQIINNKNIRFVNKDIRGFNFEKEYDLIIASLVLHFFKTEEATKILDKIKSATTKRGYNFLVCLSKKDNYAKIRPENFYPAFSELESIYSDWKIIKKKVGITEVEEHNCQGPHQHHLIFLLVQKS